MIYVVLIEPETPGNIGAIARVMKNFNLKNLILINPKCNHLSEEALVRSKHAKEILRKAKIRNTFSDLKSFDYLVATTAITGTDYNIARVSLTPEEFSLKIPRNKKIALILGRESSGLNNKEIETCDLTVNIPASKKYFTLNISHAAGILFYELFKLKNKDKSKVEIASCKEKEVLLEKINNTIEKLKFRTTEKKEIQQKVWKRIIGKSFLTKREAFALFGFFRKLK